VLRMGLKVGHRDDSHGASQRLSAKSVVLALLLIFLSVAWYEHPAKSGRIHTPANGTPAAGVQGLSGAEVPGAPLVSNETTADTIAALLQEPSGGGSPRLQAQRVLPPLRTSGGQILDRNGHPVRLNSINISSMGPGVGLPGPRGQAATGCWGWKAPDEQTFRNVQAWGFNTVRLSVSWANLEPQAPTRGPGGAVQHHYNAEYLSALDAAVKGFTGRGVAVILVIMQSQWSPAFHQNHTAFGVSCQGVGMPTWLYPHASSGQFVTARRSFFANAGGVQHGYVAAWQLLARRYASNPMVVGADMFNEPYTLGGFPVADLHLNQLYVRLGSAIRSADRQLLLIFEDSNFNGKEPLALSAPPPFPNVVYSFHLYQKAWRPGGLQTVQTYVSRALRWNVPAWIGEFDAFAYTTSRPSRPANPHWRADLQRMMVDCRAWNVGWAIWTYAKRFMAPDGREPKAGLLPALRTGF